MDLRYAGTCKVCGARIAAGDRAYWDASARTVTCEAMACCEADGLTTNKPLTGPWDKRRDLRERAERRIGAAAPTDPFAKTRSRGYYGHDAGRCEDAPCCGCCD
jgi:hypothetical protein